MFHVLAPYDGYVTLATIVVVFLGIISNKSTPDILMVGGAVFLGIMGIITPEQVFNGFTNPGVLTIAALFVIAAGVRETGALDIIGAWVLGKVRTEVGAVARLASFVTPMSAFMNNTPVVAMLVPALISWGRKHGVAPSKVLMPLSYLAILGGTCTLIGTSTNIVVNGLIVDEHAKYQVHADAGGEQADAYLRASDFLYPIGMFEVAMLGVPFAILGVIYILVAGRLILPNRQSLREVAGESSREYMIDMEIQKGCKLINQRVEEAGLRHLPGLFLVEITRDGQVISPVGPEEALYEGDVLAFTGVVSTMVDLERIPGLVPVADDAYEEAAIARRETSLCEAVLSSTSPIIGKTVRDADFRATYNAAIIAIRRGGQRLRGRVGDVRLREGDTLLLQSGSHFIRANQNNPDFYLVSGVEESRSLRRNKAFLSLGLLALLVFLMSFGSEFAPEASRNGFTAIAAFTVAGLMIFTRCISPSIARAAVDWQTLLTIAGAIGIGEAMEQTQISAHIAGSLIDQFGVASPLVMLGIIYISTSIMTELITTKGAAALMFTIAMTAALQLDVSPRPYAMAVLFAAASSFVTPIGFQTNLMVFGPGSYKFTDYVRFGLPLNIILTIAALLLIPKIWPF